MFSARPSHELWPSVVMPQLVGKLLSWFAPGKEKGHKVLTFPGFTGKYPSQESSERDRAKILTDFPLQNDTVTRP